jgi:hypothetical protein
MTTLSLLGLLICLSALCAAGYCAWPLWRGSINETLKNLGNPFWEDDDDRD